MIKDNQEYNEKAKPNSAFEDELRAKLPSFFNREGFDINKFQEALKENNINEFSEGYSLNFIGKNYARKQAGDKPTTVIVPDNDHNQKKENKNSKNLFFTGDNLEVLRHLRNAYSNKIDVIYIDPPYNTGNGDFVYPDKFDYSNEQLEEIFGMSDKDIEKLNHLKESKSHSAWLTFMYPRLWLAKQLLSEEGVIFVSIDDNEQTNLKLLMDDIFGEINKLGIITVINNLKGRSDDNFFATCNEFLMVYSINKSKSSIKGIEINDDEIESDYKFNDEYGRYKLISLRKTGKGWEREQRPFMYYPILVKDNQFYSISDDEYKKIYNKYDLSFNDEWIEQLKINYENQGYQFYLPLDSKGRYGRWRWGLDTYRKNMKTELECNTSNNVCSKMRATLENGGVRLKANKTVWYKSNYDTGVASKLLSNIIGEKKFNDPKSPFYIQDILKLNDKNAIILDFFAGSATTADAVMQLNAEDGGNRQFIMVQLPELTYKINDKTGKKEPTKGGKAAFEAGYMSIDEISRERICRASKKIKEENPNLSDDFDGGFRHYRIVEPTVNTLEELDTFDPDKYELVNDMITPFSSNALGVLGNASGEDTILTTWLVQDGYGFNNISLNEYDFLGYKAYGVEDTRLYLINGSWTTEQTEMLVNQLGNHIVNFKSIVVYGYSFNMPDLKELELALSQLNTKVELIKRY